jgi:transposase
MAMRVRNELTIQNPNAAGIDIGGSSHFVAVPQDRSDTPVREFGCYTQDLYELAAWLLFCGITVVALESTGVYWVPVYEVLEACGIEVMLVNAHGIKNVSGRKSDVLDCQWLQQLLSFGLLSAAFRPSAEVCALRTISRQRDTLLQGQACCVQRMQKALTLMNIQLNNTITDITGTTGLAIIRAIVAGERNPQELAKLRNYRIHASEAEIAKSLEGTWKEEHLFCLAQALELYDTYRQLIAKADAKLESLIAPLRRQGADAAKAAKSKKRGGKNAPGFDVRDALREWAGVDLTRIGGIDVCTALKVLVELGTDLSKFKNVKCFCSWLGLCPGTRISGGKRLSGATKRIPNRVARALKLAAQGLHHSQCALGAYYRRMAARLGKGKAITATAHKLARLVYALLTQGGEYVEQSQAQYEEKFQDRTLKYLQQKAKTLGFDLVPHAV